jgi:hypothetical protein
VRKCEDWCDQVRKFGLGKMGNCEVLIDLAKLDLTTTSAAPKPIMHAVLRTVSVDHRFRVDLVLIL